MVRQVFTVLIVLCVVPVFDGIAQQAFKLDLGEHIRIHTVDSEKIVGHVEHTRDDVLYLSSENGSVQAGIPFHSISRLEVRRRASRSQGAWKWAKRGFVVGSVAGAVMCGVDVEQCREGPEMQDYEVVLGSALFVGGGVAFLGAIGGAIFPGKQWEQLPLPNHVHLTPTRDEGFTFAVFWDF